METDTQAEYQDELGAVIRPNPTAYDMRFTEPPKSEGAQGVEDPGQIALSITAYGLSAATKSERQMRNGQRIA